MSQVYQNCSADVPIKEIEGPIVIDNLGPSVMEEELVMLMLMIVKLELTKQPPSGSNG